MAPLTQESLYNVHIQDWKVYLGPIKKYSKGRVELSNVVNQKNLRTLFTDFLKEWICNDIKGLSRGILPGENRKPMIRQADTAIISCSFHVAKIGGKVQCSKCYFVQFDLRWFELKFTLKRRIIVYRSELRVANVNHVIYPAFKHLIV